ncbi:MAG: metallophosphoesterase family protein [Gemmatimonadetes bacterium]|jgi:predicted phosphodiesterase|nr:metallophosphoesterase family protein [Gemmatimonadota bacterium]
MKSLILADIHANLAALEAVLSCEGNWDEILFLGDAVVGGPQPDEVLDLLSTLDGVFLMGNHDREILGIDLSTEAAKIHERWKQWTRRQISSANLLFMAGFEDSRRLERSGRPLRLMHGELSPAWGQRLWPDSSREVFAQLTASFPEPWVLIGHSHVQFRRFHAGRTIVNPGSIGQQRLGGNLACYAVLNDGLLELKAIPYDVTMTCDAMDRLPFDRTWVEAWKEGYQRGCLPIHRRLRDFAPLQEQGFR